MEAARLGDVRYLHEDALPVLQTKIERMLPILVLATAFAVLVLEKFRRFVWNFNDICSGRGDDFIRSITEFRAVWIGFATIPLGY